MRANLPFIGRRRKEAWGEDWRRFGEKKERGGKLDLEFGKS